MTPRTGSTLLCEALTATGVCGYPKEYFGRSDSIQHASLYRNTIGNTETLLREVFKLGTTPNGVFGFKLEMKRRLFSSIVDELNRQVHADGIYTDAEIFYRAFPNLRFIWMTRRNKVRQAISWAKARQTGIWHQRRRDPLSNSTDPQFDSELIDRLLEEIVLREAAWQDFFEQAPVTPHVVVYEDFVADYQGTIVKILELLDIPHGEDLHIPDTELVKLADELSDQWVERYRQYRQEEWNDVVW